jgi:hypothetical protein
MLPQEGSQKPIPVLTSIYMRFPPGPFPLTVTHHPMFLHLLHLLSHPLIDPIFIDSSVFNTTSPPIHSFNFLLTPLKFFITQNRTFGSSPF